MLQSKAIPHMVALVVFVVISCAFFYPQLEGKKLLQHDITAFRGVSRELVEYEKDTGKRALWTNSIFSGMPAYQIRTGRGTNVLRYLEKATHLFINRPIGYFIGAMISFYILCLVLGVSPWISIVGAIGFGMVTNSMILFDAGHASKLRVVLSAAPVIAGTLLTYRKKYLLGGALFTAALGVNLYANHYQITYYILLLLGIYGIFELVAAIRSKDYVHFVKASGLLVAGALLAFASSSSKLFTTLEYAKDTMRGKPILENNRASAGSSSETDGLAWDYAMNWSNGPKDVLAALIPRAAGGSGAERVGESSHMYQDFRSRGVRLGNDFLEPLYHGDLPSTYGPSYLGAVFIFLAFLGALLIEGRLKWWLVTAIVLTTLMSMGRHFEFFNRLLFDYVPYFNKFRAPSSILTVTSLVIPILGILGLSRALSDKGDAAAIRKGLMISASVMGGLCLFWAFAGSALMDFTGNSDSTYQNLGYNIDAILLDRAKYLREDALRSLALILVTAAAIYGYRMRKLTAPVSIAVIGLLVLIDLWGIGKRYVSADDFVTARQFAAAYTMTDIDRQILRDEDPHYRVHDVTSDPWNTANRSYFHKTIGGYHAAKLQRYQDVMDYYLYQGNTEILNMLNTKYYILPDQDGDARVQRNLQAMGNAWFVEGIKIVESADEEINALGTFDPTAVAIVHKEFNEHVAGFDPSKNGSIVLTSYAPDRLTYESDSQSDQLAVFSEIWYGPDKGWEIYIDDQPAKLIRANYILRAVNVPAGKHSIEMVFKPKKFYRGETISLITSPLILLGLIGALYMYAKEQQQLARIAAAESPARSKRGGARKSKRKK